MPSERQYLPKLNSESVDMKVTVDDEERIRLLPDRLRGPTSSSIPLPRTMASATGTCTTTRTSSTASPTSSGIMLSTAKREALGLLSITISAFAVSCGAIFVKLGSKVFSTSQILVSRFVVQGIVSLIGCYCLRIPLFGRRDGRKWVFIRGFIGSLSSLTWYYSLKCLPLADATVIMNMNPMFAAVFASIMLGEPFGWFERACATICITGAILVTKPSYFFGSQSEHNNNSNDDGFMVVTLPTSIIGGIIRYYYFNTRTVGLICALLAAMTSAAAYVSVRITGPRAHFFNHMLSLSVISILINSLNFHDFVIPQDEYQVGVLAAIASTATIGQCFLNRGLQLAPSGPGTLMCMNEIVFAFLFGVFVFREYPDFLSLLGAGMIMSVSIALGLKKWYSR